MIKLRICHYPQIPCKPFIVETESLEEACKIMNLLADYDLFQYHNSIKHGFSDICVCIIEQWNEEEQEWHMNYLEQYFKYIK